MPRTTVELDVLDGHVLRKHTAVVQGCVPFVHTDTAESYRLAQATAGKGVKPLP